jgi:hypothetical protein
MPFTPIGNGIYRSPSGRAFDQSQVKLWYAQGGKFPGQQGPGEIAKPPEPIHINKRKKIIQALMSSR